MVNVNQSVRRVASFGRRWGLPILVGSNGGLLYTVLAMQPLGERFGDAVGGGLASFAGIGLGLLMAVFVALFVRLGASSKTPNQPLQQTGGA